MIMKLYLLAVYGLDHLLLDAGWFQKINMKNYSKMEEYGLGKKEIPDRIKKPFSLKYNKALYLLHYGNMSSQGII